MDYWRQPVFRNVSFQIRAGEVVELRGGNGSGKSTLLHCLSSALRPAAGRILWFGQSIEIASARRQWVGVLAHESRLYSHLTLLENLLFVARLCGVDRPRERAEMLLEETHLAGRAMSTPLQLSRGMRQRLSIARALIHEPRIVLLDEPWSGLDEAGREWLRDRIARARCAGQTVCFSTHESQGSLPIVDRVFVLEAAALSEARPSPGRTASSFRESRAA
jgi:heme exporter protein A